jgi:hypothetical protein
MEAGGRRSVYLSRRQRWFDVRRNSRIDIGGAITAGACLPACEDCGHPVDATHCDKLWREPIEDAEDNADDPKDDALYDGR